MSGGNIWYYFCYYCEEEDYFSILYYCGSVKCDIYIYMVNNKKWKVMFGF